MSSRIFAALAATALAWIGAVASAETRADRERFIRNVKPKLKEGCVVLARTTLSQWVIFERDEHISCIEANYIPDESFNALMQGFLDDCSAALFSKLERQMDGRSEFNMTMSRNELVGIFKRRYTPLYKQFCEEKNPDLKTNPAGPEEPSSSRPRIPLRGPGQDI